ncbi:MAG: hypothetical protein HWD85_09640 [Flavobacteriaceae bacterium]|nr:hypothetical protein [Flavobacteriaceae bacterium]
MNKQEQKDLQLIIAKQEAVKTKDLLNSFEKGASKSYKKWLVAASIIAIIGITSFWLLNKPNNSENLFANYYAPYENVIYPISRTEKVKNKKVAAFESYELGNYKKALNQFNALSEEKKEDKEVITFYKAICYLQLDQPEKTIDLLRNNFKNNALWKDKNYWYLALAYLKTDNRIAAKKVLVELSKQKVNFKKEATLSLLKLLK